MESVSEDVTTLLSRLSVSDQAVEGGASTFDGPGPLLPGPPQPLPVPPDLLQDAPAERPRPLPVGDQQALLERLTAQTAAALKQVDIAESSGLIFNLHDLRRRRLQLARRFLVLVPRRALETLGPPSVLSTVIEGQHD